MDYILPTEQVNEIRLEDLKSLGVINPNNYFQTLLSCIHKSSLNIDPVTTGRFPLDFRKQKEPVVIEGHTFLVMMVSNPSPNEKKEKPSGLAFDDLSYLQVKEILFYNVKEKELFCLEYSYHYGIWDYDSEYEKYHFRYDRDIFLKNPPKKKVEHFHVKYDKPHFNSSFVTFKETIQFIEDNWDNENACLELDLIS